MKTLFNTQTFDHLIPTSPLQVTDSPAEAQLLVLGAKKVDYAKFPQLKAVYRFGVGSENVDFDYLKSRGIKVVFPGEAAKRVLFDATANFTVFGILSCLMSGAWGDVEIWKKNEREYLGAKTALVVGMGNIGRRVADRLSPFMQVITHDILSQSLLDLDELIPMADVITVHIPLTAATRNLFDASRLSRVKHAALLVNTARGEIYDEAALLDKLQQSHCRAFFDVFWQEPYHGRLKDLGPDKFRMSPHTASNTAEFVNAGFNDILTLARELSNA